MVEDHINEIPLAEVHRKLGAKMVPFAGFNMPVRYSSDIEEHKTVRDGVGVFDVSHMGEFILEGDGALDLIQKVCTNDASVLKPGKAQYSCMTNETGGIVDDLLVYMLDENKYMLVLNASNIDKDWNWIESKNSEDVSMRNISDETALFAVQGPKAIDTLQVLTSIDLNQIPYYSFATGNMAGVESVIISATGYTGAGGFELYVHKDQAAELWEEIFKAGASYLIKPIGLGARDTLRLEMGYCLYGNDLNDDTSPIEAGLGWITKFNKDFTASSLLYKQKEQGLRKKLVGFELEERGIPRKDYLIENMDGVEIGSVTSGTMSPSLNKGIGMGYIKAEYASPGEKVFIRVRNKALSAKIVKLPFFKK